MKTFREFLDERQLTIGKKIYPKYNNVLILAGGSGVGKGFSIENVIGFQGKKFDVDELKGQYKRLASDNEKLEQEYQNFTDGKYSLKNYNAKDPEQVSKLHMFLKQRKVINKQMSLFVQANKDSDNKPNIIFDVTLKELKKLEDIVNFCKDVGYDPKNIHIVWILNSEENAIRNNQSRGRTVNIDVLKSSHEGAAKTMREIINNNKKYTSDIDGDIWIVPNQQYIDTSVQIYLSKTGEVFKNKIPKTLINLERYTAFQIKEQGKQAKSFNELEKDIQDKIKSYIPKTVQF